jgi:hypothetical protein
MRRRGDADRPPGGHAEERRRQFERERGLSERRRLDLEEDEREERADRPENPEEGKKRDDEGT